MSEKVVRFAVVRGDFQQVGMRTYRTERAAQIRQQWWHASGIPGHYSVKRLEFTKK